MGSIAANTTTRTIYEASKRLSFAANEWSVSFLAPLDPCESIQLVVGFRNAHALPPRFLWTLISPNMSELENPALARQGYPIAPHFLWRVEGLLKKELVDARGDYESIRPIEQNDAPNVQVDQSRVFETPVSTRLVADAPELVWYRQPLIGAARLYETGVNGGLYYEFAPANQLYYLDASWARGYDAIRVHLRIPQPHGAPTIERPFRRAVLKVMIR